MTRVASRFLSDVADILAYARLVRRYAESVRAEGARSRARAAELLAASERLRNTAIMRDAEHAQRRPGGV